MFSVSFQTIFLRLSWCLLAIAQVKGWLHPLPCHNVERPLSHTAGAVIKKGLLYFTASVCLTSSTLSLCESVCV